MKTKPYIGITGLVTTEEVDHVLKIFAQNGVAMKYTSHIPMLGFLVSYQTLNGKETANKRYPPVKRLPELLERTRKNGEQKAFPMIHYNSREPDLAKQVIELFEETSRSRIFKSELCKALQLNVEWPYPSELRKIKWKFPGMRIVFQLNKSLLEKYSIDEAAKNISEYCGQYINYILIDPSGGKGEEFDIERSAEIFEALKKQQGLSHIVIGFAGGFIGENTARRVNELGLRIKTSHFSIDAEGGLRDKIEDVYGGDTLNIEKAEHYIRKAASSLITRWR